MKKLKMARGTLLTFEEGCDKYLENCRQRNLREGTINHYALEHATQVAKGYPPQMRRFASDPHRFGSWRACFPQCRRVAFGITVLTESFP